MITGEMRNKVFREGVCALGENFRVGMKCDTLKVLTTINRLFTLFERQIL